MDTNAALIPMPVDNINPYWRGFAYTYTSIFRVIFKTKNDHPVSIVAIERAENAALQGDVIAALSLDVLKGTTRAYDSG